MKTILIISAVLLAGLIGFFLLNSHIYKEKQAGPSEWTSSSTYEDSELGFLVRMPESWQEIGYRVTKNEEEDSTSFRFELPYVDEHGNLVAGMASSVIVAIPLASYVGIDSSELELARNAEHVFISRQSSPEAFGACREEYFRSVNGKLCEGGSGLRNPERIEGAFVLR